MTTEERKEKKKSLYSLYEPYFKAQGIESPYFVPKPIRKEGSPNPYMAAAFFENELNVIRKTGEVYVENIDWRDMSRQDDKYILYKWTYNPYWNDESEGYEKIVITSRSGETFTKYAIPLEEFTVVGQGLEYWESFKEQPAQESLPLFDMSSISGVKPKHEPIDQSLAFGNVEELPVEGMDTKLSNLTARDLYALVHRRPISSVPEINEFINKENNI